MTLVGEGEVPSGADIKINTIDSHKLNAYHIPCTYGLFPSAGVIKGSLHKSRSRQELQERQITCWGKFPTNDNYHEIILILLFQRAGIEMHKFCAVHSFCLYLYCTHKFKIYAL